MQILLLAQGITKDKLMRCPFFQMPLELDLIQFQDVCHQLFEELGPMQVQAWPELEVWLDDWAEETPSPVPFSQIESFILSEKELKNLLGPEFNTIYTIKEAQLFSKFFLAAYRHDGFAPIFTPLNIKHYELTRIIHLGERLHCPQVRKRMGVGAWALCIGCYSVCEEDDSVIFISHDAKLKAKIKEILQNLATSTQDIELNIEKPIRTDT